MRCAKAAAAAVFIAAASVCWGQAELEAEGKIDPARIAAERARVEESQALAPALKTRLTTLYDQALEALQAADAARAAVRRYERERRSIEARVKLLRAELAKPPRPAKLELPRDLSVSDLEARLAQQRALLEASRSALREIERLAERSAARRTEIARRLGQLDREIEDLNDQLSAADAVESNPEVLRALRLNLNARRLAATAEKERLRAELVLLEAQSAELPWRRDQARRRVESYTQMVALLEDVVRRRRHEENQKKLEEVKTLCRRVVSQGPGFDDLAGETEKYASMLWGEDGVLSRIEATERGLADTRRHITELDRISELTRRRFEAAGSGTSYRQWWPNLPPDFPKLSDLEENVRGRRSLIPELQLQLIHLEEQRSEADRTAVEALQRIDTLNLDEKQKNEMRRLVDELTRTRRDLLDELIRRYTQYLNRLLELDELTRNLLRDSQEAQAFLYENLYWSRTIAEAFPPRSQDLLRAALWLLSPSGWRTVFTALWTAAASRPGVAAAWIVLLAALLILRRRLVRRLEALGRLARDPEHSRFFTTVEALIHTALLAAPLPLALWVISRALASNVAGMQSEFAYALSLALYYLAGIAALFSAIRHLSRPNGLAEAHFGGSPILSRRLYRGLVWAEYAALPLLYVCLHLGWAGMRLDSPEQMRPLSDSLGRLAFVAALIVLAAALFAVFRPRWTGRTEVDRKANLELRRVSYWAYPVITLVAVVPALAALFGYYLTGLMLAFQFFRTISVAVALLVLVKLLERWWDVRTRRVAALAPETQAATEQLAPRVRQLFHFSIIVLAAIGFYGIWSDALPALQALKRVQVYPTVTILSPVEEAAPPPAAEAAAAEKPAGETVGDSQAAPPLARMGAISDDGGAAVASSSAGTALTLWNIGQALLALLITIALVRDVPGMVELVLLRRPGVDSGARVAASTLVRYAILIGGMSVTFGLLGLSWSKIQWLAAALTFGLGFGLQEIVANFVSGLILLVERPVRVGDAVTIGNLQGRVSRIQIRATTISLWDRSEMIVPNKEFITNKLVNWTLSDSKRRVDIPVRVAYGVDVKKVKQTLLAAARRFPQVLTDPPPQALLLEFGEQAMKFELRFFVDFGQGLSTRAQVHEAIEELFRKEGIEFATPVLSLKAGTEERGAGAPLPPPDGRRPEAVPSEEEAEAERK